MPHTMFRISRLLLAIPVFIVLIVILHINRIPYVPSKGVAVASSYNVTIPIVPTTQAPQAVQTSDVDSFQNATASNVEKVLVPVSSEPASSKSASPEAATSNKYAFSAFLAAPSMQTREDNDDVYFVGTRMLIYQLLHDPKTRTNNSYPFVVLATSDVGSLSFMICL
jgi:hypothetical protein